MRKFVSGLVIGILLTSTLVFSFANIDEIKAVFGNFNFVINGEKVSLQTQPIVVNGSTYLPVREIAKLLGYEVDYDSNSKTIILESNTQIDLLANLEKAKDKSIAESIDLYSKYQNEIEDLLKIADDAYKVLLSSSSSINDYVIAKKNIEQALEDIYRLSVYNEEICNISEFMYAAHYLTHLESLSDLIIRKSESPDLKSISNNINLVIQKIEQYKNNHSSK